MTTLLILLLLLFAAPANATVLYTDRNITADCVGDTYSIANRNCAGTDGQGYKTIATGRSHLASSDTLLIRSGTYTENFNSVTHGDLPSGGSLTTPTTISSYPGCAANPAIAGVCPSTEAVTIRGQVYLGFNNSLGDGAFASQYVMFNGITIDGSNESSFTNPAVSITCSFAHIKFLHVRVTQGYGQGVNQFVGNNCLTAASDVQWINSEIDHNGRWGCDSSLVGQPFGQQAAGLGCGHGFYIAGSSNNLWDHVNIHDNGESGIHMFSDPCYGPNTGISSNNNIVQYSLIQVNGFNTTRNGSPSDVAVVFGGGGQGGFGCTPDIWGTGNIFHHNVVINNAGGIDLESSVDGALVYNNTVYNNNILGNRIGLTSQRNAIVRNNIIYPVGSVSQGGTGAFVADHNWLPANGNPNFVNPPAPNCGTGTDCLGLHLAGGGAVDSGVASICSSSPPVSCPVNVSFNGSSPDAGAYESGAGIAVAINSPTLNATYTTTATPVTLIGTSTGATSVSWSNNQGGGATCSGTSTWTCSAITLAADKVNTITVTASNGANAATTTLQVAYSFPALVGSWAFDENGGTTALDRSGFNNNGTFGAGVAYTTATVKYGISALSFSGGSVTVNDAASLRLIGGWTITAQVYPFAYHTDFRAILVKNYDYYLYAQSASCSGNGPLGGHNTGDICAPAPLSINAWSCVASTYDGTNLKLYINKALVQTIASSGLLGAGTGTLQIGNSQFAEPFDGALDNLRLYNYDVGPTQINTDCDTGIVPAGVANFKISGATGLKSKGATAVEIGH